MDQKALDAMKAGTGFVASLRDSICDLQKQGYTENLSAAFDHFESQMGKYSFYPAGFTVDLMVRFENSSDPDDQAILFAIRSHDGVKGVYVDSYGLYHNELSPELNQKLKDRPH